MEFKHNRLLPCEERLGGIGVLVKTEQASANCGRGRGELGFWYDRTGFCRLRERGRTGVLVRQDRPLPWEEARREWGCNKTKHSSPT